MRVKILVIALLGAIVGLPLPAPQLLAVTVPAAPPTPLAIAAADFRTLIEDPFLIDRLSYAAPQEAFYAGA